MANISLEVHSASCGAKFLRKKTSNYQYNFSMAKISLEVYGVQWGAEFLRKRNLQSKNTAFSWLKFL